LWGYNKELTFVPLESQKRRKKDMAGEVFNEMIGGWQMIPTYTFKKPSKFQTG